MAIQARAAMEKTKGVKQLVFDSTGVGYYKAAGTQPTKEDLEASLAKKRLTRIKITSLKEVDLQKSEGAFELSLSGLA